MYIFYDLETSDISRDFSQIFQIAMVFADDDLNMLSSKDLSARRLPWVIPAPAAMLTTGFTPDDLKKAPLSFYEMMRETDKWLRAQHWPLIFVGYNSLSYDEGVLRQGLHQSLHDPFLTTSRKDFTAGSPNGRADVMNIVKAAMVYAPDLLKLDIKNVVGGPSLTLGNVARQNGVAFSEDEAHEAFADVKATIAVARLIKAGAPAIWQQMMALTTGQAVDKFLNDNKVFSYVLPEGREMRRGFAASVGAVSVKSGMQILFDLSKSPRELSDKTVEELTTIILNSNDKNSGSAGAPVFLVNKKAQPVLMPLSLAGALRTPELTDDVLAQRQAELAADTALQEKLRLAAVKALEIRQARSSAGRAPEIEEQMLDFPPFQVSGRINRWKQEFREASGWDERARLIAAFPQRFADALQESPAISRFMQFAKRWLYAEAPAKMPESERKAYAAAIARRLLDADTAVPYMTIPKARAELEKIEEDRASGKGRWVDVPDGALRSLKLYYTALEKEMLSALPAQEREKLAANGNETSAPASATATAGQGSGADADADDAGRGARPGKPARRAAGFGR